MNGFGDQLAALAAALSEDGDELCRTCGGSGRLKHPKTGAWSVKCPACGGTGLAPDDDDGQDDAAVWLEDIKAELQADYYQRLSRWEANAPKRRQAAIAMERARLQRAAELGMHDGRPAAIAAALDWMKPEPPKLGS